MDGWVWIVTPVSFTGLGLARERSLPACSSQYHHLSMNWTYLGVNPPKLPCGEALMHERHVRVGAKVQQIYEFLKLIMTQSARIGNIDEWTSTQWTPKAPRLIIKLHFGFSASEDYYYMFQSSGVVLIRLCTTPRVCDKKGNLGWIEIRLHSVSFWSITSCSYLQEWTISLQVQYSRWLFFSLN